MRSSHDTDGSISALVTLLSAARNHRHASLAHRLYDRMTSLFAEQKTSLISASILLANTYSSVGDDQQAKQVRLHRMKHYGQKVQMGVTWTEVKGRLWVRARLVDKLSAAIVAFLTDVHCSR